jgi:hypothetical protein
MPKTVADPASTMKIQRFSCTSGQIYRRRDSRTTTSVAILYVSLWGTVAVAVGVGLALTRSSTVSRRICVRIFRCSRCVGEDRSGQRRGSRVRLVVGAFARVTVVLV